MKGRVLLVEDDYRVRQALSMILMNANYDVTEAVSVRTALMHLDISDLVCVVLDLVLPNGHGRQVVRELKDKRDDVPVVILSAFHGEDEWAFPVVAVLEKPTKRDVLLEAVRKAAEASQAIRLLRQSKIQIEETTKLRLARG